MFRLLIMAGIPILLVLAQPDLGTAMVMVIVLLVMLAVAGLPIRILILLVIGTVLVVLVAVESGLLHHYQIARLTAFLNPSTHSNNPYVQSAIYNRQQSLNAIGSGGIFGSGIVHGAQTNLGYVPEQQTDFIFTAVGEQLGFVGAVGAAGAPRVDRGARAARVQLVAVTTSDACSAVGVFTFFAFSCFQNAGMIDGDHAGHRASRCLL